ncbi:hypothetical protein GCM10009801_20160 [Streptomyces albiaxialis]|uniref:Uncharacterized protein n=1 Tax=Streptomyces albiaxialis TaxID=329523 RepID=A0ABN2VR33_9ACTN
MSPRTLRTLTRARRAALRAACAELAMLDDAEFGARLLADTPTHEGRDPAQLLRWAESATSFGAELATGVAPSGPGEPHTRGARPEPGARPAPDGIEPTPGAGHGDGDVDGPGAGTARSGPGASYVRGPRRAAAGAVRGLVLGADLVDGDGDGPGAGTVRPGAEAPYAGHGHGQGAGPGAGAVPIVSGASSARGPRAEPEVDRGGFAVRMPGAGPSGPPGDDAGRASDGTRSAPGTPGARRPGTGADGRMPGSPDRSGAVRADAGHSSFRVVEREGGVERLLLARYVSRPVPAVELYVDTLALGEEVVELLGWREWYPVGALRAAALAHEEAHCALHGDRALRRALRARVGHTALRLGRRRLTGHVAGADELAAHGYAAARCGLGRTPLLLTAALASAVRALEED